MNTAKIEKLSDREHVLKRPNMYIGSISPVKHKDFYFNLEKEKFEWKEEEYVPGLIKIINEVIDNSIDEAIKTNFKKGNKISVKITDRKVIVEDNGRGISTEKEKTTNLPQAVIAFTHAKAGSNFSDEDRKTIGLNGVGAFVCAVFSKNFKVETRNGKDICKITLKKNLTKIDYNIRKSKGETFTKVEFEPDFERFGLESFSDLYKTIIYQRLLMLSHSFPQIQFKFNGKKIYLQSGKKFMKYFSDCFEVVESDKFLVGLYLNNIGEPANLSYVNGLKMSFDSAETQFILNEISWKIRGLLVKKYKLKYSDILSNLIPVIIMKDFPNPQFNSQTKEKLANSQKDLRKYFKNLNLEDVAKKIVKNKKIINPIIEIYKAKEELKNRSKLNELNKNKKKVFSANYISATKKKKNFFICEGLSAMGGLSSAFGREENGFYGSRGVPLNAYEAKISKVLDNKELKEIINILNLSVDSKTKINPDYERIIIASDSDLDGIRIVGLHLGNFYRFFKYLYDEERIYKLRTPVIIIKDKKSDKIKKMFFTIEEFQKYQKESNIKSNEKVQYYKGLGTWKAKDLKNLVEQYGFEYFLEKVEIDDEQAFEQWLKSCNVDMRKEALRNNEFEINKI